MFQTILLVLGLVTALSITISLLRFMHRALALASQLTQHRLATRLTKLVIAAFIMQLHNGQDFAPYTLKKAQDVIQHYLTDLLLMNGYHPRSWNPKYLVQAELVAGGLLGELKAALEIRRNDKPCQDSTSGTPTTLT